MITAYLPRYMFWWREETHTNMGRTCKLHTEGIIYISVYLLAVFFHRCICLRFATSLVTLLYCHLSISGPVQSGFINDKPLTVCLIFSCLPWLFSHALYVNSKVMGGDHPMILNVVNHLGLTVLSFESSAKSSCLMIDYQICLGNTNKRQISAHCCFRAN